MLLFTDFADVLSVKMCLVCGELRTTHRYLNKEVSRHLSIDTITGTDIFFAGINIITLIKVVEYKINNYK